MISFSCSDVGWSDVLMLWQFWCSVQYCLLHIQGTIGTNIYGWNTIYSILSISSYINSSIILLPTISLSLLSFTLFGTLLFLCIMIGSCTHVTLTWLAGITFASLMMCSVIFLPVAHFVSTNNIFIWYSSFNLKVFERHQLYEIWPYMVSIITCPGVYITIYSYVNLFYSTVNFTIDVWVYGASRPSCVSMKSISYSRCLILM